MELDAVAYAQPQLYRQIDALLRHAYNQLGLLCPSGSFTGYWNMCKVGYNRSDPSACYLNVAKGWDDAPGASHIFSINSGKRTIKHRGEYKPLNTEAFNAALDQLNYWVHSSHAFRQQAAAIQATLEARDQEANERRIRAFDAEEHAERQRKVEMLRSHLQTNESAPASSIAYAAAGAAASNTGVTVTAATGPPESAAADNGPADISVKAEAAGSSQSEAATQQYGGSAQGALMDPWGDEDDDNAFVADVAPLLQSAAALRPPNHAMQSFPGPEDDDEAWAADVAPLLESPAVLRPTAGPNEAPHPPHVPNQAVQLPAAVEWEAMACEIMYGPDCFW